VISHDGDEVELAGVLVPEPHPARLAAKAPATNSAVKFLWVMLI
jgi:hypothetical protein